MQRPNQRPAAATPRTGELRLELHLRRGTGRPGGDGIGGDLCVGDEVSGDWTADLQGPDGQALHFGSLTELIGYLARLSGNAQAARGIR